MKRLVLLATLLASGLPQAAELYNNGPVVDGNGRSVLTLPATTLGFGVNGYGGLAVADDFSVAAGVKWNVSSLDFYAYKPSTFTLPFPVKTATWSIVSGDLNNGTVVASGVTAVSNGGLVGYRVTETTLHNQQRAIFDIHADVNDFSLNAGHYWLRWSLSDDGYGPWQPPTADGRQGNAAQSGNGKPFSTLTDSGSQLSLELPFALQGSVTAVPEADTYAMLLAGLGLVGALARRRKPA
ncbi:PEP-CTERM sorting domain-containing protein [Rugamonas sp. CCM 8940]|uniref:PEP-CTERM sorting domain-containing protein n=1 Tax=Rugamonas sp. CCM 8940 TaxID=2765359 RepID=UPI0018F3A2F6|nr:PEP-CTERM sorting domain-containing protein [Rugamonas sp. CCM 8940]MBJ7312765.1 PEP-CTERM sorting domain-containing protein [Rugamonas sp. CCM 8940]